MSELHFADFCDSCDLSELGLCVTNEKGVKISFQCFMKDGSRSAAHVVQTGCANWSKGILLKR